MQLDKGKLALQLYEWYVNPVQFFRDLYKLEPYFYQADVLKMIPSLRRIMIVAGGGTGKTQLLASIGLWKAIVFSSVKKQDNSVLILSGSLDQAKALYDYSATPLQEHPILSQLVDGEILKTMVKFTNGTCIRALPLSLKSIQGKHFPVVIVDEAALVDDFTIMDTNRIIGGEIQYPNNTMIYSGTPTDYTSLFVNMWEDEKLYPDYFKTEPRNPLNWARFSWSTLQCPRFSTREIEEMKMRLTDEQFTVFWLGKPYPVTNTVVPIQYIRKQSIGYERFKYDPSRKTGKIVFGIDWGQTAKSILVIVQLVDDNSSPVKYTYKVLECLEWTGQQYDDIHDWIEYYAGVYKPDYIFVDSNPKGESDRCINKLMPRGYYVQAVNLGVERSTLQTRMKYIFEHEAIVIPQDLVELLNNVKSYTWDKTKDDDYVTGLMLALRDITTKDNVNPFYYKIGKFKRH